MPWSDPEFVDRLIRVLTLQDHNTRVVVLGVSMLGLASGLVGTFLLLRKRSLTADALSHATLPGIGLAFVVGVTLGGTGKSLPLLLAGAFVSGVIGMAIILAIRHTTRLKDDAALGIVLSVFYGLGVVIIQMVTRMEQGNASGLDGFILGKAASMLRSDALIILGVAGLVVLLCGAMFKELKLLCFDTDYFGAIGWPVRWTDAVLMGMVVLVTVIGLQSVGLILIVAMLIIPPAAARFWCERLGPMTLWSGAIGLVSGLLGAAFSALQPRMPTGPVIVLAAGVFFVISLLLGSKRGGAVRAWRAWSLRQRTLKQHGLRAMYETLESRPDGHRRSGEPITGARVSTEELLPQRSWTRWGLAWVMRRLERQNLVRRNHDGTFSLTDAGLIDARRVVRNHRLWETYLITHADIAPSHVDRDADAVEHVLAPTMIDRLEDLLEAKYPYLVVPPSPHALAPGAGFEATGGKG